MGCQMREESMLKINIDAMKETIVLTIVAIASQAVAVFAGEPVVSSKQVVAPPPPPPPKSFFRPNEFDIGAFATWAKFTNSNYPNGTVHGF
jgi:hypothetical protein